MTERKEHFGLNWLKKIETSVSGSIIHFFCRHGRYFQRAPHCSVNGASSAEFLSGNASSLVPPRGRIINLRKIEPEHDCVGCTERNKETPLWRQGRG